MSSLKPRMLSIVTHPLFLWAVAGTVIRLLLAPYTSWTGDVIPSYFAARDLAMTGNPYATLNFSYPPLIAFLSFPLDYLAILFGSPVALYVPAMVPVAARTEILVPVVTSPLFNMATKTPMIVADFLVGWLLYSALLPGSAKAARRAFVVWYLNPLVILVGSVQGQFDVLPALLVLAASISLLQRQRWVAGLALAAAIALKAYAVFLLPLFVAAYLADLFPEARSLLDALRRLPESRAVRATGAFLGAVGVGLLLFFVPSSGTGVLAVTRRTASLDPGGFSGVGLFFQFTGSWTLPYANFGGFPSILSSALIAVIALIAVYLAYRAFPFLRGPTPLDGLLALSQGTVLVLLVVFVFSPLVNPQYLLWILPSAILLSARWRTFERSALVLSLAGVVFEVGLLGWAAYLYPVAVYTGSPSVASLNAAILGYWSMPGFMSPVLTKDVTNTAVYVGVAALAWIGVRSVGLTRRVGGR